MEKRMVLGIVGVCPMREAEVLGKETGSREDPMGCCHMAFMSQEVSPWSLLFSHLRPCPGTVSSHCSSIPTVRTTPSSSELQGPVSSYPSPPSMCDLPSGHIGPG